MNLVNPVMLIAVLLLAACRSLPPAQPGAAAGATLPPETLTPAATATPNPSPSPAVPTATIAPTATAVDETPDEATPATATVAAPFTLPAFFGAASGGAGFTDDDPLANATYRLNATLPAEPLTAPALLLPLSLTQEQVLAFAQKIGVSGDLYLEVIPGYQDAYVADTSTPLSASLAAAGAPILYRIFDGLRTVAGDSAGGIFYHDDSPALGPRGPLVVRQTYWREFAYADSFILQHDLRSDGVPYFLAPYSDSAFGVEFQPVRYGGRLLFPELAVMVSDEWQVVGLQYRPLDALVPTEDYPLRPAAAAWQDVLDGLTPDRGAASLYPVTPGEDDPLPLPANARAWRYTGQPGQTIDLYAAITLFHPVNGPGSPRVHAEHFLLQAAAHELEAMRPHAGQVIHVWGEASQDESGQWLLDVAGWEPLPEADASGHFNLSGVVEVDGTTTVVRDEGGQRFLLRQPPDGLATGDRIEASGHYIAAGAPPEFHWLSLSRLAQANATIEAPTLPRAIQEIIVEGVELAYAPSLYLQTLSLPGQPQQEYYLFHPVWLFYGRTDTHQTVELIVDAVAGR